MSEVIVLTGSPGVGKTTVTDKALESTEKTYQMVNYGDKMLEVAKDQGLVEDRDQMRKLEPSQQKNLQKKAGEEISKMAEEKPVIVDTHSTIKTPRGYLPGMPEWVLKPLNPDLIIVIEADPQEIISRRKKDQEERERDLETEEDLAEHQSMNRSAAMAYSVFTGATVKIIQNHDGKLEEAAQKLSRVFDEG
ncbi:MAG: Archaeal adenylate kinase AdkA [Candidatus Methanohalarchaeum thermophilum]|uniref:Adenylate kinase n=1 Tax=Methanohalarchaeum thermophilum TaxID=1903181 RepID=A0A1Q6DX13_METT1|nr:MAG: Archaeal adenylate kinase AdkA [Candidatus Methanohalarchaeum thermophilum]